MIWDLAKGALILVFCVSLGMAVIVWGAQKLWQRRSTYDPSFADAPDPVRIQAALDLMYEDLRAKLTPQQLIRTVLLLCDQPTFGAPKDPS